MTFLFAILLAAAAPAGPPPRAGQCRWVHGRFSVWNGSSVQRIWVIGTRRIVALRDEDPNVPPEIRRYEAGAAEYRGRDVDGLSGEFYICARENGRPGHMQHVRLLQTRYLRFRGRPFPGR
ncbi:MAG: hypothetical protein ACJ8ER_03020 [Allosphingosinicella sp.]